MTYIPYPEEAREIASFFGTFFVGDNAYCFAETDWVSFYEREVREIVSILQHPEAWVSDMSTLDLFPTSWKRLEIIAKKARCSVRELIKINYIWKIAAKIHDNR